MSEYLKNYKVILKTLSPVFIGSGEKISKKEYIYYRNTQEVLIPDMNHLFSDVLKRNMSTEFERYLLEDNQPLLNWMKSVGYKDAEIRSLCQNSMDCSQSLENLNRPVEIQRFMKDAYGMPYIPGSSLKGVLRNCLLSAEILRNPKKYEKMTRDVLNSEPGRDGRKKGFLRREGKSLESEVFHTLERKKTKGDALNDVLQALRVADSEPIAKEQLILCQKVDVNQEGGKNALNTLRECLKPETEIELELTIDTSILSLTKEELQQAVATSFEYYTDVFVKKFIQVSDRKDCIYLGGGCGYGTKTILYSLLDDAHRVKFVADFMNSRFSKHGHRNDVKKGVSPHMLKCTRYQGKMCEMGKCQIDIEEK